MSEERAMSKTDGAYQVAKELACLDIPRQPRERQIDAIAKAIRAGEDRGKKSMLTEWQKDTEKWEQEVKCSDEEWEEMLTALHFYAEPAVYQATRSGDTAPIWCDTDATFTSDGEDMPGAAARAVLAKLREKEVTK